MKYTTLFTILFCLLIASCSKDSQNFATGEIIENPSGEGARYPYVSSDESGALALSWIREKEDGNHTVEVATRKNEIWSDVETITENDHYFVNWADFASIVMFDGNPLAAHWLKKVDGGTYAYHVQIAFRNSDGSWSAPITPHLDRSPTEHGFVSMIALDNDRVLAIWLDGRKTGNHSHAHDHSHHGNLENAMTLRSAEIHRNGDISRKNEIDAAVCDCCQTHLIKTPGGAFAVYRNRTESEIRDIYGVRYNLETGTWSDPKAVSNDGWEIAGCPVNGPRAAFDGETLVVSWFTINNGISAVYIAESTDFGSTFGERKLVSGNHPIGRVDIVATSPGNFLISYLGNQTADLKLRPYSISDGFSDAFIAGKTDGSRAAGFPRMTHIANEGVYLAWTRTNPNFGVVTKFIANE